MKRSSKTLSVLPLLFSLGSVALADRVEYVDLASGDGIYINDGTVRVSAKNGVFNQVTPQAIQFHLRLKAGCGGNRTVSDAFISYGGENVSDTILEASGNFKVDILHRLGQKDLPFTAVTMNVPLNKTGLNPVQMCNQLLQQKKNMGVSEQQFFARDQVVTKQVLLTGVAQCEKNNGNSIGYGSDKYTTMVKVICEAGSGLPQTNQLQAPKLSPVAVPLGGNNSIQAGENMNPLTINSAQITTNSLQFSGNCPAKKNFTVRMNGSGKGQVRYHIVENGQDAYVSPAISFDGAQKQHNFSIDITSVSAQLNQKIDRSFRLFIELKDQNADSFDWSNKGEYTALNWSQTCQARAGVGTPSSLAPATPNDPAPIPNLNIKSANEPQPPTPGMNFKAQDNNPAPPPAPGLNIKTANEPQPPTTPMNFKAAEQTPPGPVNRLQQPVIKKPQRQNNDSANE